MSTSYLEAFFEPTSIAIVGASERALSMGGIVLSNLIDSGFAGELYPVNAKGYKAIHGIPAFKSVASLPQIPSLAIICTPPETVPKLIRLLSKKGVKAALILTGGLSRARSLTGRIIPESLQDLSRKYKVRIMGPNCLGILVPKLKLNASYAQGNIAAGEIAFVGQSAITGSAIIDWANGRGIGFSHFLTLGDGSDVTITDVIDFLSTNTRIKALLLHIEYIPNVRHFMSALRSMSRHKLVVVIKSARVRESQLHHIPDTPGIPDQDQVYDQLFARAGVLRVGSIDELFSAVNTLTRVRQLRGERLAIISNGVGPGVMATDRLIRKGGVLAPLTDVSQKKLAKLLPLHWERMNPMDLNADAGADRYREVMSVIAEDPNVDALLVIFVPTARAISDELAQAVIDITPQLDLSVLACWMGEQTVSSARHLFDEASIPSYDTPGEAIAAFLQMIQHRKSLDLLREAPPSFIDSLDVPRRSIGAIFDAMEKERRCLMRPDDAIRLLHFYQIPAAATHVVRSGEDAAESIGDFKKPCVVKLLYEHNLKPFGYGSKSQGFWKAIVPDIYNEEDMIKATRQLRMQLQSKYPTLDCEGFSFQSMHRGYESLLINMGITRDPIAGPLIVFGGGGAVASVLVDRQIAFPPLNVPLAKALIDRSHVAKIIREIDEGGERIINQLAEILIRLSQMVVDWPQIKSLEIHPFIIHQQEFTTLDVKVEIGEPMPLAILPYPQELCEKFTLPRSGRPITIRPIRAEDEHAHLEFHEAMSAESLRMRFFTHRHRFSHRQMTLLTQLDYDREMAFVVVENEGDKESILGVVRTWTDSDNILCEFAVMIREDITGEGLGSLLMTKMINYCKKRGTLQMMGLVLQENTAMLKLSHRLGFFIFSEKNGVVEIRLPLNKPGHDWQKQKIEHIHTD